MSDPDPEQDSETLLLQNHEDRLKKLEEEKKQGFVKTITTSASTSALFLGLVLSSIALYDALVRKPEADRVARITQFDQAINSAAKVRQDMVQMQMQTTDPRLQLNIGSMSTPQILNNISSAKAILRNLDNQDVEIPQLIVLANEALNWGDLPSAKEFVDRAVGKMDVSPYLRSEAMRLKAKYSFTVGNTEGGRKSFEEALTAYGNSEAAAAGRAYILGDYTIAEFLYGDCDRASAQMQRLATALQASGVPALARLQIGSTVAAQLRQTNPHRCVISDAILVSLAPTPSSAIPNLGQ